MNPKDLLRPGPRPLSPVDLDSRSAEGTRNGGVGALDDSSRKVYTSPPPLITKVRLLTEKELNQLRTQDLERVPARTMFPSAGVNDLRTAHHYVARDLAQGHSAVTVARTYGLSVGGVQDLEAVPAFRELIEYYRHNSGDFDPRRELANKMAVIAHTGLDRIAERLERSSGNIKDSDLNEITGSMLDRIGAGRVTKVSVPAGGLDHQELKNLKKTEPGDIVLGAEEELPEGGPAARSKAD